MKSLARHAQSAGQLHFINKSKEKGLLMPFIDYSAGRVGDQIKGFQILGALFVRCIREGYFINDVFSPHLFRIISMLSYTQLSQITNDAKNLPHQLLTNPALIENGINGDVLRAVILIAKQMHTLIKYEVEWNALCQNQWKNLQKTKHTEKL